MKTASNLPAGSPPLVRDPAADSGKNDARPASEPTAPLRSSGAQARFIARGLAAGQRARETAEYVSKAEVMAALRALHNQQTGE